MTEWGAGNLLDGQPNPYILEMRSEWLRMGLHEVQYESVIQMDENGKNLEVTQYLFTATVYSG